MTLNTQHPTNGLRTRVQWWSSKQKGSAERIQPHYRLIHGWKWLTIWISLGLLRQMLLLRTCMDGDKSMELGLAGSFVVVVCDQVSLPYGTFAAANKRERKWFSFRPVALIMHCTYELCMHAWWRADIGPWPPSATDQSGPKFFLTWRIETSGQRR